jgi:hypothetical protein
MTGGFDANVPARKPRTKIARVISDLTSGPQDGAEGGGDRAVVEDAAPAARDTVADSRGDSRGDSQADYQADYQANRPPDAAVVANHSVARVAGPSAVPPTGTSTAASPTPGGREQIARLRERLAAAANGRRSARDGGRAA